MGARHRYQEFFYVGSPTNSIQHFAVPAGVSLVHVTMVGGGGGGGSSRFASSALAAAAGGGGGEFCVRVPVYVQPSSNIEVQVGEPGWGYKRGATEATGQAGSPGGTSRFGALRCAGGLGGGGSGGGSVNAGSGGGPGGGVGSTSDGASGSAEMMRGYFGGSAGGGYFHNSGLASRRGGRCAGVDWTPAAIAGIDISPSSVNSGGGSGASSMWGFGGKGGDCGNPPADNANGEDMDGSTHYGSGGGGAGTDFHNDATKPNMGQGGNGAPGYVCVYWIEDDSQGSPYS